MRWALPNRGSVPSSNRPFPRWEFYADRVLGTVVEAIGPKESEEDRDATMRTLERAVQHAEVLVNMVTADIRDNADSFPEGAETFLAGTRGLHATTQNLVAGLEAADRDDLGNPGLPGFLNQYMAFLAADFAHRQAGTAVHERCSEVLVDSLDDVAWAIDAQAVATTAPYASDLEEAALTLDMLLYGLRNVDVVGEEATGYVAGLHRLNWINYQLIVSGNEGDAVRASGLRATRIREIAALPPVPSVWCRPYP
jgi:hypothetical protein